MKVSRDGKYSKPPHAKLSYGTMVFLEFLLFSFFLLFSKQYFFSIYEYLKVIVRAGLVAGAYAALGQAVTIATRYSTIRRQGNTGKDGLETKILDYKMQQYRLLPLIATAYGLHFTGFFIFSYPKGFFFLTKIRNFFFKKRTLYA